MLPAAAGASSTAPLVTAFAASATAVPSTGGVVTFTGASLRATRCTLSVVPTIKFFPSTCSLTTFVIPAIFPPNLTKKAIKYVVTVRAKKVLSSTRTLKITELPKGAPIVLQWSSVGPAFNALGSLSALSCTTACVAGDDVGNVFTLSGGAWKRSTTLSQPIDAIACWSSTSCLVVGSNGLVGSNKTGVWVVLNSHTTEELTAVSCSSATLCVAVGVNGDGLVINPSTASVTLAANVDSLGTPIGVSCVLGTTSCLAVDDAGNAFAFTGTWGTLTTVSPSAALTAVSCPTTNTCLATTDDGSIMTLVNGAFASSVSADPSTVLTAISCVSSASCVATDVLGKAIVLSGGTWKSTSSLSVDGASAVSCTSVGHCLVLTPWSVVPLSGTTTGSVTTLELATGVATAVSCVTTVFCESVSSTGYATAFNGTSWGFLSQITSASLSSVSCPTLTFCMAVGDQGTTVANSFGSWTTRTIDGSPSLTSVSCVSASFCMAVNNNDNFYLWSGSNWSAAMSGVGVQYRSFDAVSCASTTFCSLTDNKGHMLIWNGSSLSEYFLGNPNASMDGVSCPTTSGCVFGDSRGLGVLFASGPPPTWNSSTIDTSAIVGLSCVDANYCFALDDQGSVVSVANGTWGTVGATGSSGLNSGLAVSCVSGIWCMALDQNSGSVVGMLKG